MEYRKGVSANMREIIEKLKLFLYSFQTQVNINMVTLSTNVGNVLLSW